MAASSRKTAHLTKIKTSQTIACLFDFLEHYSNVTEPQSKRAALCGETGDSHHTKEEMLLLHLLKVFIGTDPLMWKG